MRSRQICGMLSHYLLGLLDLWTERLRGSGPEFCLRDLRQSHLHPRGWQWVSAGPAAPREKPGLRSAVIPRDSSVAHDGEQSLGGRSHQKDVWMTSGGHWVLWTRDHLNLNEYKYCPPSRWENGAYEDKLKRSPRIPQLELISNPVCLIPKPKLAFRLSRTFHPEREFEHSSTDT